MSLLPALIKRKCAKELPRGRKKSRCIPPSLEPKAPAPSARAGARSSFHCAGALASTEQRRNEDRQRDELADGEGGRAQGLAAADIGRHVADADQDVDHGQDVGDRLGPPTIWATITAAANQGKVSRPLR